MTTDKHNKRPNVPPLRFPEFTDEWTETNIGSILSIGNGKDYKDLGDGNIPVFGTGGYMTSVNDYLMDGESVFIGRKGTINKPSYYKGKFWTVDTLFYTHEFIGAVPRFVLYLFENIDWLKYNEASGVPSLSKSTIEKIKINIPKTIEQKKISAFISLLDQRIAVQSGLINKLESLISGITLSVVKSDDCESIQLTEILTERNEVNTAQYEVYSVSVSQGVVNQVEYLGRSFAAKDTSNYNVVHYGDIVYTKSPTGDFPYGIVKRSDQTNPVAVSPLYGVYTPASNDIGCFLHYYFCNAISTKNYLHKLIQKGAKNTINITNQRFLENTIKLPNAEKLAIVVKLLNQLSMKKQRAEELLALYRKQKHYLLSQMFI